MSLIFVNAKGVGMEVLFRLYRVFTREKVSSLRLMLYVFLGYALSEKFLPMIYTVDAFIVLGGILFASLLNDFYDYVLLGEKNEAASLAKKKILTKKQLLFMAWCPWIFSLLLFVILISLDVSFISLALLWGSFLLSWAYSAPPIRLKERKFLGLIVPPIGIFMLFFQAICLGGMPDSQQLMISTLVFVYTWHLDFLHLAEDSTVSHETQRINPALIANAIRITCIVGIILSAIFFFWHWIIIVSLAAWTLRFITVRKMSRKKISKERKNIFSGIYRIEEFIIYGAAAILKIISGWVL
jgi:hypothetical protein